MNVTALKIGVLSMALFSIPVFCLAQKLNLKYVDVSASVVMLENEKTSGSNITCVAVDNGLIFFDCSLFTEIAEQFRADMEKRFNRKAVALVLTHGHTDHFFGMGAFSDVDVYASEESKGMFDYQLNINFNEKIEVFKGIFPRFDEALKSAKIFMPTKWFGSEIKFGAGDRVLGIKCTGGHSIGSCSAFLTGDNIIIVGDNVQVDSYPYFGDRTGNMFTWIDVLKKWEEIKDCKICPGHGRTVDNEYLASTRFYFEELTEALKKFKSDSLSVEEVIHSVDLPDGYWPVTEKEPTWWDYALAFLYKNIEEMKNSIK